MDDEESDEKKLVKFLGQSVDTLVYNTNILGHSNKYMHAFRKWVIEMRIEDEKLMEKIVVQLEKLQDKSETPPNIDGDIEETLKWLARKTLPSSSEKEKKKSNPEYACYEDMLLRYRDLNKKLDNMKMINKQIATILPRVTQEYRNMCQMNDKLDEIRYRWKLVEVGKTIEARGIHKDPLAPVYSLPVTLCGIIFHDDTSQDYAATLLNISKRLLVISEAIQYERNSRNEPIVTMSNLLPNPPQSAVASLYVPVQIADGNGEVFAPEEKIVPTARDSAHTLFTSENGEVPGTSEMSMPIAKDSRTTLESNELPKPVSKGTGDEDIKNTQ